MGGRSVLSFFVCCDTESLHKHEHIRSTLNNKHQSHQPPATNKFRPSADSPFSSLCVASQFHSNLVGQRGSPQTMQSRGSIDRSMLLMLLCPVHQVGACVEGEQVPRHRPTPNAGVACDKVCGPTTCGRVALCSRRLHKRWLRKRATRLRPNACVCNRVR